MVTLLQQRGNSSVSGGNSSNKRRRANPANGEDYRGDGDGNDGFRSQYEKRGTNSSKLANKDDDGSIREADGDGEQDTKLSRKSASSGSNGGKKKASSGTSSGANNGGSGVTNGNSIKKKKSGSTLTSGSGSSRQSKNLKSRLSLMLMKTISLMRKMMERWMKRTKMMRTRMDASSEGHLMDQKVVKLWWCSN